MTQLDRLELVRLGNPEAIAAWLNDDLAAQKITVSVDREGSRLSIGLYGANENSDQPFLISLIEQKLQVLNNPSIRSANIFGYQVNNPIPLWSHRLDLEKSAEEVNPFQLEEPFLNGDLTEHPTTGRTVTPVDSKLVDRFLVCGLGSLGQYCVLNLQRFALREFEVHITAIDKQQQHDWEVEKLTDLLAEAPIIGDCRNDEVLLKAGVKECRAILLVTNNESDNIEAAIAARRLNPTVRIIVRSSRHSLNQLLKQQLGDFIAFEPTELPAAAFALAGLKAGILGFFNIGNWRLQVVEQQVQPGDYRFDGFPAVTMHKKTYRLLSFASNEPPEDASGVTVPMAQRKRAFYQWNTNTRITSGDTIAYIEIAEPVSNKQNSQPAATEDVFQQINQTLKTLFRKDIGHNATDVWRWFQVNQTRRIIGAGLVTATCLWILGTVLLKFNVPMMTWQKAISTGAVLLLGGYGDVFGGLQNDPVPWWVQLISLLITAISLLFILGVLGLIADNVLTSRFDFLRKRPIPKQDHVVVVGFGRVGQRVATLLREFKQPIVAITEQWENTILPVQIPLVVGDPIVELAKVNLPTAKSVVVVTDDQMLNLEVALMAREAAQQVDRDIELVVRAYGQRFRDNLVNLLPDAKILAAYALSAEAFAGAAFGENILGLFRLNNQTILVTEYHINETDTLAGKLLSQVAYGYSVVPIFHQRGMQSLQADPSEALMPSDDRQLQAGDRLIVLASINGLRRIERREITPPQYWRLEVQKPLNDAFKHYAGNDLARISGCSLDEARELMSRLPGAIELPLYEYQAYRLLQELSKQLPVTLSPL